MFLANPLSTGKPDWPALAGAAATGVIHLVSVSDGRPSPYFIVGACVFWIAFVILRGRQDRRIFREWGFRYDDLFRASLIPFVMVLLAVPCMALYASLKGQLSFPAHTLLPLLLYPVWGVVQQFLILGLVVGNLSKISFLKKNPLFMILLGAFIFGAVHLPDPLLTAATTGLALVYVPLFLHFRHLWPLGVVHGWLGTLFYLWVLNIDPWLQLFPV